MLHFTSSILTLEPIRSSLFSAVGIIKKYGGGIFFDVNLTLPLWISREHTWSIIKDAWQQANFIEVTKHELEFLLGEENCKRRPPQYAANSEKELRVFRDEYHYKRKEIAPIWHDNLKLLIVLDGTYVIHYYTPGFDGEVLGVEDVLVAPDTCDRAGSADAMVGGMLDHPSLSLDAHICRMMFVVEDVFLHVVQSSFHDEDTFHRFFMFFSTFRYKRQCINDIMFLFHDCSYYEETELTS